MMTSALAYPAPAETNADAKPPSTSGATPTSGVKIKDMRQFSQAGHSAMMNIGDARLAIFDGDPKIAMKLMESAKALLAQADKEAPSLGNATGETRQRKALSSQEWAVYRSTVNWLWRMTS